MGLFDDLLKNVDKGLKAVESGALEERLHKVADKLDHTSEKVDKTLGKMADKPAQILQKAEAGKDTVEQRAHTVKQQVVKNIDIIHKKD